jgi:hypothetical protein
MRFTTRMKMKAVPKIKITDKKRKKLLTANALKRALYLNTIHCFRSNFSFENAIRKKPDRSDSMISSSEKLVFRITNHLISRNQDKMANTGRENLKSNQRYKIAIIIPEAARIIPANLYGYGSRKVFMAVAKD